MYLEHGPYLFRPPKKYATGKAAAFPSEGGPVILAVDVPDEIIALAVDELFPPGQGLVQFEAGAGLEELLTAWPGLWKQIRQVDDT